MFTFLSCFIILFHPRLFQVRTCLPGVQIATPLRFGELWNQFLACFFNRTTYPTEPLLQSRIINCAILNHEKVVWRASGLIMSRRGSCVSLSYDEMARRCSGLDRRGDSWCSSVLNYRRQLLLFVTSRKSLLSSIGDKIVQTLYLNRVILENKESAPLPCRLHSKLGCLLFSIGTTLHGGDGGGKAIIFPPLVKPKKAQFWAKCLNSFCRRLIAVLLL